MQEKAQNASLALNYGTTEERLALGRSQTRIILNVRGFLFFLLV